MTADEYGAARARAQNAHLILEQFAQRFDELHAHALGQAADIVVGLDRHRRAAGKRHALDHVGIERPLREEVHGPFAIRAMRRASASKVSMNRRPIVRRLASGSSTPSSACVNFQPHGREPAEC